MRLKLLLLATFTVSISASFPKPRKYVCYFGGWSLNRTTEIFSPEYVAHQVIDNLPKFIPLHLCTHVIFAYVGLDVNTGNVIVHDTGPGSDIRTGEFTRKIKEHEFKNDFPIMFSLGGPDFRSEGFSKVMRDPVKRATAVNDLEAIMKSGGFDGIDVHWMTPVVGSGGAPEDKDNLSLFMTELRERLPRYEKLLTVTIGTKRYMIDYSYNFTHLYRTADWLNVAAYNFHTWEYGDTGISAPLFGTADETVDMTISRLLQAGVPASSIVLSVSSNATTYSLLDISNTKVGSPARAGPDYSDHDGIVPDGFSAGFMEFFGLCLLEQQSIPSWVYGTHENNTYAFYDEPVLRERVWLSFENETTYFHKGLYASAKMLDGVSLWAFTGFDTSRGVSCAIGDLNHFDELFRGVRTCPGEAKLELSKNYSSG